MKLFITAIRILFLIGTLPACSFKSTDNNSKSNDTIHLSTASAALLKDTAASRITAPKLADTLISEKSSAALGPEQSFINYAVTKNTKEIFWLKAALIHGTLKEMKQHTLVMMKDHKRFAKDLRKYIDKHPYFKMPVPDTSNTFIINERAGLNWDESWIEKMIENDDELLLKLQAARSDIRDSAFTKLIVNTIPLITTHLAMAKSLQAKLKITMSE